MKRIKFLLIIMFVAAAMAVSMPAYNIYLLQPAFVKLLTNATEDDAIQVGRLLANKYFSEIDGVVGEPPAAMVREVDWLLQNFGLMKLKLFSPDGHITFSTVAREIGDLNEKPYFHDIVAQGNILTKLVQKDQKSLEGQPVTVDVVETYVPIMHGDSFAGAFEIYYDITERKEAMGAMVAHSTRLLLLIAGGFLLLLAAVGHRAKVAAGRQEQAEEEVRRLAFFDDLTDLPNRRLLHDRIERALYQAQRSGQRVALFYFDLDHFKKVNDTLGHDFGDLLLKQVSERILGCLRKNDTLARFGGDEFIAVLGDVVADRDMAVVADKIINSLATPFDLAGQEVYTSTSIGIAVFPENGSDKETLMKCADMALYDAKNRGRGIYKLFSEEMNREVVERRELEDDLRRALRRGELRIAYQPQLDLDSGRMCGIEALLRWNHPEKGEISPARIIQVAEETGLILPLGDWVMRTACAQAVSWQQAGLALPRIGVNLSGVQFRQPDFVDSIRSVLEETGLDPSLLELELTESTFMNSDESSIAPLNTLKAMGIHLAMDDFGTGYSSLGSLKSFPFDRLKIDRGFVRDLAEDADDAAIIETIIAMAHTLRLQVIAEGVETKAQLDFLRSRGCQEIQGFFYARPMPAEEVAARLELEESLHQMAKGA